MKPNVLIAGCLALFILCTCAVAGVQAVELYAEPDAVLGEWSDPGGTPTDAVDPKVVDGAESATELCSDPDVVLDEWSEKPAEPDSLEDVTEDPVYGCEECADSLFRPDSTDEDPSDYKFATQLTQSEDYYVTAYYCVYESEMDGTQTVTKTISDKPYTLKASFLYGGYGVSMQGTGRTSPEGDYIHCTNPSSLRFVKISDPDEFTNEIQQRYTDLGITDFTGFGNLAINQPGLASFSVVPEYTGASGRVLAPWYSVAVDRKVIPLGTIGILDYVSGTTPAGSSTMKFRADDTGGDIEGKIIDVYVGEGKDSMDKWESMGGNRMASMTTLDPEIPPMSVPLYSQNDPKWKDDSLGTKTIGGVEGIGCALTSTAMVFKYYGVDVDPQTLNEWLKSNNGYDGNNIKWGEAVKFSDKISSFDRVKYKLSEGSADLNKINAELKAGRPVIAHVNSNKPKEDKGTHFVVITGYEDYDVYILNDPNDGRVHKLNESRYATKYNSTDEPYSPEKRIWGISVFTPNPAYSKSSNVDVALIIDSSGSMSWNDPNNDRLAAANMFIELVDDADQIAVIDFASSATVRQALAKVGEKKGVLMDKIGRIGASGTTNIGGGLLAGYNELNSTAANPAHKKAAILLTDGEHNTGKNPLDVIGDYSDAKWPIYAIAFTEDADTPLLKVIAKETGGEYYASLESDPAKRSNTLKGIYDHISQNIKGFSQIYSRKGKISLNEIISGYLRFDSSVMLSNALLTWSGSDLDLVLYYPDGNKVTLNQSSPSGTDDPDISYIARDTYEIYKLQNPQPGTWRYDIIGVEVTGQEEDYTLALSAATTIKLGAHTDKLDYAMGEGVRITANFTEDGVGIPNAQVTANVTLPDLSQDTQVLSDSGGGMYEGTFYATQSGHYSVLIEAQRGADVIRQREIEFDVSKKVVPPPVANFTADKTRGVAPLSVQFTDISTGGAPTVWEWDFGDGNTATVQNPTYTHTYTVAGTYTVKLTITNAGGSNTSTRADYITVTEPTPAATSSDSSGDDSSVSTGSALAAGGGASFSFAGLPVSTITIESEADISRALIIAERVRSLPGSITPPEPEAYQYLAITPYRLEDADFDEATISFHVPVGYLSAMGKETTDVALMRYVDGQWVRLKTTLIKEEGGRAYYEAVTPGFSVFAIVLEKDGATVAAPVSTLAPVATVGEEEEKDGEEPDVVEPEVSLTSTPTPAAASAATPTPKEAPVIYAPIGLVIAGLLAFALRRRE